MGDVRRWGRMVRGKEMDVYDVNDVMNRYHCVEGVYDDEPRTDDTDSDTDDTDNDGQRVRVSTTTTVSMLSLAGFLKYYTDACRVVGGEGGVRGDLARAGFRPDLTRRRGGGIGGRGGGGGCDRGGVSARGAM